MPSLLRVKRSPEQLKGLVERGTFTLWRLTTRATTDRTRYSGFLAAATYLPWRADATFHRLHHEVSGHTLVPVSRLYELYDLVGQLAGLPGDLLEVGVWRGGSGCLIAAQAARTDPKAAVFLADTFSGVVKAGERDPNYGGGEHSDTSEATVRALGAQLALTNIDLLVGTFPDDTAAAIAHRRFKLAHIDVDTYRSAADVTQWVWPRLSVGGVLVYDDYGTPTTSGVREFVDEFRGTPGARVIHNLNQHAIVVKFAE